MDAIAQEGAWRSNGVFTTLFLAAFCLGAEGSQDFSGVVPGMAAPAAGPTPSFDAPREVPADGPREEPGATTPKPPRKGKRERESMGPLGFGLALGFAAAAVPLWGPQAALRDDPEEDAYFPRYPYDQVPGYLMVGSHPVEPDASGLDALWKQQYIEDEEELPDAISLDRWKPESRLNAGRLDLEYGDQFEGSRRIATHLLLSGASRSGLSSQYNYIELRRNGRREDYQLGDFNLLLRFAQSQHAEFRAGAGFNWLQDDRTTDFGFNLNYAADLFPVRPWVLSASFDWGRIRNFDVIRGRTTVGAILGPFETYTGYEYLEFGQGGMHNLVGGIRVWF